MKTIIVSFSSLPTISQGTSPTHRPIFAYRHIIHNYTVLHSLCTLLFVIGQGIISITQSSCRFSRFHKNKYYNVANP